MSQWQFKTIIYSGDNSLDVLNELNQEKIFVVCDPFLTQTDLFKTTILNLEANNIVKVYSNVVPNPPIENVVEGLELLKESKSQTVIAIGGGSAIDLAKAMKYFANVIYNEPTYKFIAIPTTSGTGSEVTSFSVITDEKYNVKYPMVDASLVPDIAILSTDYVLSCPPKVTAHSGLDVLTHALEALVAKNATLYTDTLAQKAVELVFNHLEKCFLYGQNRTERLKMHEASCLAGLAFDAAGLGICHAIAHQLGGQFHIIHGLANAILLPEIVKFNANNAVARKKFVALVDRLNICDLDASDETKINCLVSKITELTQKLNCETKLSQLTITKEQLVEKSPEIVHHAMDDMCYGGNPIAATPEDLLKILFAIL